MTKILKVIFLLLISSCSLDSNSSLWTKHKKVQYEESLNIKKLSFKKEILKNEINSNVKIKILKRENININLTDFTNNNGITNYNGELKKISKFNFSKIKYFNQYEPEINIVKNNIVFFDNKGSILKFNNDSKLIWKKNYYSKNEKKNNPFLFFGSNANLLIIADNLAKYYAINIDDGSLIWTKNNSSPFNSQIKILNDKFYVIDDSNTLNCYSIKDGSLIWNYKTEKTLIKSQKKLSMVVSENKIIFVNNLGDITAIDSNTGTLIWQTPTQKITIYEDAMFLKTSDLVLAKNSVLLSNNSNEFFSINLKTGLLNWKQNINSSLRPTYIEDYILTISDEGYFIVLDFKTGKIIRSTDLFKNFKKKKREKIKPVGFIVGSENIYLTTSVGRLIIANIETGNPEAVIKIDNKKISRPITIKQNMFIIKENSIVKLN